MKTWLAPLFVTVSLSACATVTEEDRSQIAVVPQASPADGTTLQADSDAPGKIVLFRTWNGEGLVFLATGPKISVNGREVGRCLLGKGSEVVLEPGTHEIRAPYADTSARQFQLQPGQTVYVECKYTAGALAPNFQFEFHATRPGDAE